MKQPESGQNHNDNDDDGSDDNVNYEMESLEGNDTSDGGGDTLAGIECCIPFCNTETWYGGSQQVVQDQAQKGCQ